MKMNCWEFKKCGRQPGGEKVKELSVCPAAVEKRLNGVHGGRNAGRACWIVAGTYCQGKIQGTFADKYSSCKECDFYQRVREEEYPRFKLSAVLLALLNETKK